jgi:hypothetical protein
LGKYSLCQSSISADPAKVEAIARIPIPKDKKRIFSFFGMMTYLSRFLPKLSTTTKPLQRFTYADEDNHHHMLKFSHVKEIIKKVPVLGYFDVKKAITQQCDASNTGLRASLLQDGRPIIFSSSSLTKIEGNFVPI